MALYIQVIFNISVLTLVCGVLLLLLLRPKLDNIDRSNPVQKAITVNSITVLITEYNPLYPDSD